MTDLELRPIDRTEFPAFYRVLSEVFLEDPHDEDRESLGAVFEPERSLAALDDGQIVATAGIYTRDMTVPGGPRPVAGVTVVSVQPTHRRRGLLTAMMRRQLTGLHEEQARAGRRALGFRGRHLRPVRLRGRRPAAGLDRAQGEAAGPARGAAGHRPGRAHPAGAGPAARGGGLRGAPADLGRLPRPARCLGRPARRRPGAQPARGQRPAARALHRAGRLGHRVRDVPHPAGRRAGSQRQQRRRRVRARDHPGGVRGALGLPGRHRPHAQAGALPGAAGRPAAAHRRRRARSRHVDVRLALGAAGRRRPGAGVPDVLDAGGRGARRAGRVLPVERRPVAAVGGRVRRGLRADAGPGRPGAVLDRARRGLPGRADAGRHWPRPGWSPSCGRGRWRRRAGRSPATGCRGARRCSERLVRAGGQRGWWGRGGADPVAAPAPGAAPGPDRAGPGEPAAEPGHADSSGSRARPRRGWPRRPGTRPGRRPGAEPRRNDAERSLRGIVGAGSSQVGVVGAMRARDAARPTAEDIAAAERDLVIVRRHYVPPDTLPGAH